MRYCYYHGILSRLGNRDHQRARGLFPDCSLRKDFERSNSVLLFTEAKMCIKSPGMLLKSPLGDGHYELHEENRVSLLRVGC